MKRFCWSILFSCAALSGCYTYRPLQTPAPRMEVRVRLTAEAAARASHGLDEPILRYDGRVVAVGADTLALDVLVARSSSAVQDITIRDTVTLRRADLQEVLERKLSPTRSALFTVGTAVAAYGVIKGIDQIVGGTGSEDTDPGTPNLRQPFFARISFTQLVGWLTRRQ